MKLALPRTVRSEPRPALSRGVAEGLRLALVLALYGVVLASAHDIGRTILAVIR